MNRILIVEDDKNMNNGIKLTLGHEYCCIQSGSIQSAKELMKEQQPDLILLDLNLPDGNGLELLIEIRKSSQVPVILLTANKMEMDIVAGLESGANDYVTKPFSLMELRARVGVQLRGTGQADEIFQDGEVYFDFGKMEYWKGGCILELSKTEQKLLHCLIKKKGKSVSRSQLIDEIWQGETEYVDEHALTVVVNRIRKKLGSQSEYIKTVYGIGYTWEMK